MKLSPDRSDAPTILGYGPGWIGIGHQGVAEKIEHSLVIGSRGEKLDWQCTGFAQLGSEHFDRLAELAPEVVIFGSGPRLRFAPLLVPLLSHRLPRCPAHHSSRNKTKPSPQRTKPSPRLASGHRRPVKGGLLPRPGVPKEAR